MTIGLDASFRTLGVTPGASLQEVRTAYRRLARLHHPDSNPAAQNPGSQPRALGDVVAAYRVLEQSGLSGNAAPPTPLRHIDVYA